MVNKQVMLWGLSRGPAAIAGGPAFVQSSCTANSQPSPVGLRLASSTTAGGTIVVKVSDPGNAMGTGVVVSNNASVWTEYPVNAVGGVSAKVAIYVSTNIPMGGVISATATVAGVSLSMCIEEYSGVTAVQSSSSTTGTSVNVNTGTGTVVGSASMAIGAMTHQTGGTITITEINSETLVKKVEDNSAFQSFSSVYKLLAAAAESMRWTTGSSVTWAAVMVVLK